MQALQPLKRSISLSCILPERLALCMLFVPHINARQHQPPTRATIPALSRPPPNACISVHIRPSNCAPSSTTTTPTLTPNCTIPDSPATLLLPTCSWIVIHYNPYHAPLASPELPSTLISILSTLHQHHSTTCQLSHIPLRPSVRFSVAAAASCYGRPRVWHFSPHLSALSRRPR